MDHLFSNREITVNNQNLRAFNQELRIVENQKDYQNIRKRWYIKWEKYFKGLRKKDIHINKRKKLKNTYREYLKQKC